MIAFIFIGVLFMVTGESSGRTEYSHNRTKRATTVVGGEPVEIVKYPYLIQIHFRNPGEKEDRCAAAAIAPRWALTAAHCIKDFETAQRYLVWNSSTWNAWEDNPEVPVDCTKDCFIHPQYNEISHDNDVALIYLSGSQTLDEGHLIRLSESTPAVGTRFQVAGWGTGPVDSMINQLHEVYVPVVNIETCNKSYDGQITQHMLCAGYDEGGKDACSGDSGGPAVAHDKHGFLTVYGIISFGFLCAKPRFYGVYVDVSTERIWIDTTVASKSAPITLTAKKSKRPRKPRKKNIPKNIIISSHRLQNLWVVSKERRPKNKEREKFL